MPDKHLTKRLTQLANVYPQKPAEMNRLQRNWPELATEVSALPPIHDDVMGMLAKYTDFPEVEMRIGSLRGFVQRLWVGVPETATLGQILLPDGERMVDIDWKGRSLAYNPRTTIQRALYYLLQHSDLAKVCANIECVRPFFLGIRPNERYCSAACFDNAQRLAKAAWWKTSGTAWRKSRKLSRRKT
jgi:hypothetical protein